MNTLTCSQYLEQLLKEQRGIHTVMARQFNTNGLDADELYAYMLFRACNDAVELLDLRTWAYEQPIVRAYEALASNFVRR